MIYTITAFPGESDDPNFPKYGNRVFGYYEKEHDAHMAVLEDRCSMHECLYDYIVVEECNPGVHATNRVVQWYSWDYTSRQWEPCGWPTDIPTNVVNFSMG